MASALMLGAITSELPPAAAVIVAGGAIAAAAVYAYEKIGGKDGYHTTYQPVSQNPIHYPMKEPDKYPNGNNWFKWLMGGMGAYEAYDAYQENLKDTNFGPSFNTVPQDNTFVAPVNPYRPR